jgi:malonate decarboxylase delta subunit
MEKLIFEFQSSPAKRVGRSWALIGVVSSGNLEVLIELNPSNEKSRFIIQTSAKGFTEIWHSVLKDFIRKHSVGNLQITINDAGATPAVVSLRLDQAMEEWETPQ